MEDLQFTIPELLSLIGVTQCVYILVHIAFRARNFSHVFLPGLYFLALGMAFLLDFGQRFLSNLSPYYETYQWLAWFFSPPLSFLLIIQIFRITRVPDLKFYAILFLPFAALVGAWGFSALGEAQNFQDWFVLFGLMSGAISLLAIWLVYPSWTGLHTQKYGRERYWLIIALVVLNAGFLVSLLGYFSPAISPVDLVLLRTILGLGFIYLVMTSLFRLYPPSVQFAPLSSQEEELNAAELEIALKIENLLALDKIYHEPGYSRTDLARELNVPETLVSKVINLHFKKSFPRLLNEHRVEDAKRLLEQTDEEVQVIAQESGFNSVASFNRAFKEITGKSPGVFRKTKKVRL